ncbi:TetR/AcrR family transcriptional regulator [Marinoscillum luteum]|uniref:TetR/AcrR family transcriptional regulator n=1 Tax=Marinoscillum luteum TaxID=861051 RepID=A0ABW7N707_9BACT
MESEKDKNVRDEIVLSAQKLFQQFGLKKTTMDEIAADCEKAKSTLYHYFKSKEEVYEAVVDVELVNLRRHVKVLVDGHKSLNDKIETYFNEFHRELLNKVNIYRIVKQELASNSMKDFYFEKIMKYEISYVTRLLEDGYDSDEFKSVSREDIPWFSETLLAAFLGIVKYSIARGSNFDFQKLEKVTHVLVPKVFS